MVYGIVVAGGQGTRLGRKKQFLDLAGSPVWRWSVNTLRDAGVDRVFLVVPAEDVSEITRSVEMDDIPVRVVPGGQTRFHSVRNGLGAIGREVFGLDPFAAGSAPSPSQAKAWVAVHDAARPFVSASDVRAVIRTAKETGAAILARPCADTVKRVEDGCIRGTLPRHSLWLAETPQVFRLDWMWEAYRPGVSPAEATDDAWVMEQAGHTVQVVASTAENRKITTPADWAWAQMWAEHVRKGAMMDADRSRI
ncbi:2-C-methyl-D-erythritol 4-phosphate cytidylyltransferase [Alicyclobacillus sp.]|uniref:2-C-methyl-D-erythritol 4-phosphate cytidylyltransferase n=1 Tax=Alicyclobacillus sp. TaxID=61169 RepID=UPI0025C1E41D|nr:2-C-methyl-D-erythritol 4-phosphate cytidylyltransferase [Alicyclobacillus sp.]MCL6517302.1 2-C-methyl-D-erythritol 4-phosphate cytidylyltransferase [Alicyclobacillus sp.]